MVAALVFFVCAWLVVRQEGSHLLPPKQYDHEPNSYLSQPAPVPPARYV